jgi:hypothetical protein
MYSFSFHSPTEGHLGYLQVLAIMNKVAMNIHSCVVFCVDINFKLIWVNIKERHCLITWQNSIGFVSNSQTVFQSGCTIMHFLQQWVSFSSTLPLEPFLLWLFLEMGFHKLFCLDWLWPSMLPISASHVARITGVSHWCLDLMTHDFEHLFVCLLAICVSSLVRCLFRSFAHL